MRDYLKVRDYPGLVRDPVTKAIISVDDKARKNYVSQKAIAELSTSSVKELKEEVDTLKNDISELKLMIQQLLLKR